MLKNTGHLLLRYLIPLVLLSAVGAILAVKLPEQHSTFTGISSVEPISG